MFLSLFLLLSLSFSVVQSGGEHSVILRWDANPPEDQVIAYSVYRSQEQSEWEQIGITETETLTDEAVPPGAHYYTVTARNECCESEMSEVLMAMVPSAEPVQEPDATSIFAAVTDSTPTVTEFATNLPSSANEAYTGWTITFLEGPLDDRSRVIKSYGGASRSVEVEAFAAPPGNGDSFFVSEPEPEPEPAPDPEPDDFLARLQALKEKATEVRILAGQVRDQEEEIRAELQAIADSLPDGERKRMIRALQFLASAGRRGAEITVSENNAIEILIELLEEDSAQ